MKEYKLKSQKGPYVRLPRHREGISEEEFSNWCKEEERRGFPLAIDLFSGAGGLGLGVEAAGWTVVASTEINDEALETHRANFRGLALKVDMSDRGQIESFVKRFEGIRIDLVVGGPPCQPFSRAGRSKIKSLVDAGIRDEHDSRRELWQGFVDTIKMLAPRAVIMENVPDIALGDGFIVVRKIAKQLERIGYDVEYRLMDAWRYGVPQHRKRFILMARNDGEKIYWPEPSGRLVTVRDAIGDLPKLGRTQGRLEMNVDSTKVSDFVLSLRDGIDGDAVYDHVTRAVRDDDYEAFKKMTPTTKYSDLPDDLKRYRTDIFDDKYKRLSWDELSRTITAHIAKDGYWYIHPEEHRTITVREAARIQTFPDSFRFVGSRTHAFTQIGNAVPPKLGEAIAAALQSVREDNDSPEMDSFTVREIRKKLIQRFRRLRSRKPWYFPDKNVSTTYAFLFAYLDAFSMRENDIRAIHGLFKHEEYSYDLFKLQVRKLNLSPARMEKLHAFIAIEADPELMDISKYLSKRQLDIYHLLIGNPVVIVSEAIRKKINLLFNLPNINQGLLTDIKTATAQLIGIDSSASLIMCGLLVSDYSDINDIMRRIAK